jgi:hypothetical protein
MVGLASLVLGLGWVAATLLVGAAAAAEQQVPAESERDVDE